MKKYSALLSLIVQGPGGISRGHQSLYHSEICALSDLLHQQSASGYHPLTHQGMDTQRTGWTKLGA